MKIEEGDLVRWESPDKREAVQGVCAYVPSSFSEDRDSQICLVFDNERVEGQAWVPLEECALIEKGEYK